MIIKTLIDNIVEFIAWGVLAATPLLVVFINNKIVKLKHYRDKKTDLLKVAKEYALEDMNSLPILYKDRMAKVVFDTNRITYYEAKYLMQYENADYWVAEYIKYRLFLVKDRGEDGEILMIRVKQQPYIRLYLFIAYMFFSMIGILPVISFKWFLALIVEYYENDFVGLLILCFVIPIFCLTIGIICLLLMSKITDANIFIKQLYKKAYKPSIK